MIKQKHLLILILTIGVFGILNTEMGVIGLLPSIAERFEVSVTHAGLLVSVFALGIAIAGPIMPLLFSGMNRKKVMLLVLGIFVLSNIVPFVTNSFNMLLVARIVPALFHPIYCSLAFTVAASSVSKEEAPKAVSKVFIGISAGMVVGVPIASFMNSTFSYEWAMAFFLMVNALVFIATLVFVPSLPVKEKLTYGSQITVLKHPVLWISIIAVILLNSSIFGIYSYLTEYLGSVSNMSSNNVSLTLFIYGSANIIGNIIVGRLLTHSPSKAVFIFPLLLIAVYVVLFFTGHFTVPMIITTIFWGIVAGGIMTNINQHLIISAAPQAPDFANGLFISACNIGTTVGAAVGGMFISVMGTPYVILAGIVPLVLGFVIVIVRHHMFASARHLS